MNRVFDSLLHGCWETAQKNRSQRLSWARWVFFPVLAPSLAYLVQLGEHGQRHLDPHEQHEARVLLEQLQLILVPQRQLRHHRDEALKILLR